MKKNLTALMIFLLCTSCKVTSNFPICPKLWAGIEDVHEPRLCNNIVRICQEHHITISVLNVYTAQFTGPKKEMQWLQANYHILICDFDRSATPASAAKYITCIVNSSAWIKIIQGANPAQLFQSQYHFDAIYR